MSSFESTSSVSTTSSSSTVTSTAFGDFPLFSPHPRAESREDPTIEEVCDPQRGLKPSSQKAWDSWMPLKGKNSSPEENDTTKKLYNCNANLQRTIHCR